jgi:hypothetical protein
LVKKRVSQFGSQLAPARAVRLNDVRPAAPRLVMIWMTPFDASVP